MNSTASDWFMLSPAGVLHAFANKNPSDEEQALQSLLTSDRALDYPTWYRLAPTAEVLKEKAIKKGWVQMLSRPIQGPDSQLDNFLQHVIGSLSGERRAVLASDSGFCLSKTGVEQDQADALSVAAADYAEFVSRQAKRGWSDAPRNVAFHADSEFLLPTHCFVPFWVDGTGYWLILMGEPLINNPALVELVWGIKLAGTKFKAPE